MEFAVDVEGCTESWRGRVCLECQGRHIPLKGSVSGGILWQLDHDSESAPNTTDEPISIEEGDRILATSLFPPLPMDIQALSTISQRLAEAFQTNEEAITLVPDYLKEFTSIFSKQSFDILPEPKEWDHAVELVPGSKPSGCKVYPLSQVEQKELDAFLKENLEAGQIQPSKSLMSSPVFFIKKKDGSLRLVQDYQALNAITVKNKCLLPLISELINKLQGARYFTKLDVHWGFNNVQMKEGDEWKAAFQTDWGLYEPLVMFFGLTNSPATFQTMMDGIFEDLISEGVVMVYLDNILIFTKTLEEHRKVVHWVLELLQQHGLSLKPEKCEFEKTSIEYLGVVASHNLVKMDPAKLARVAEWPTLSNKKEVQSFLGFTNFYQRFIEGSSHIPWPLFDLTKANSTFKWSSEEKLAFDTLKDWITSAPILALLDNSRPYWVEADSSYFTTRAVLSQQNTEDNKWHPIAFLSKSLSPVKQNYEIHDKEMLAIVQALEEWRHFLEGAKHQFAIWMDHKNLEYVMTAKKLNQRGGGGFFCIIMYCK